MRGSLPLTVFYLGCALWGASIGIVCGTKASASNKTLKVEKTDSRRHDVQPQAHSRLEESSWKRRHEAISQQVKETDSQVVFLGDSITSGWRYVPTWQERFGRYQPINAGISSDRVEHLLWRVRNGNLDYVRPKAVVLLIGINNLAISSPEQIVAGVRQVIAEIHRRSPVTQVLLLGIFPSGKESNHPRRAKIASVNRSLAELDKLSRVDFLDIGKRFLEADGSISKEIMPDYLHLSADGYKVWADAISPHLERLIQSA